jgi:hypothetical protein
LAYFSTLRQKEYISSNCSWTSTRLHVITSCKSVLWEPQISN